MPKCPKCADCTKFWGLFDKNVLPVNKIFTNGETSPKSGRTDGQKMTVGPFRFKSLELDGNEKKLMSHPMQIEK